MLDSGRFAMQPSQETKMPGAPLRPESIADNLPALPEQPAAVPWPTEHWSRGEPAPTDGAGFAELTNEIFELPPAKGVTYALLAVHKGQLCYERYDAGANPFYFQYSWSMAKSITQALAGILVEDGHIVVLGVARH